MTSTVFKYGVWSVTLDPGGFVVRDHTGAAIETHYAKHKAIDRCKRLALDWHAEPLFEPAPDVIPGQMTL